MVFVSFLLLALAGVGVGGVALRPCLPRHTEDEWRDNGRPKKARLLPADVAATPSRPPACAAPATPAAATAIPIDQALLPPHSPRILDTAAPTTTTDAPPSCRVCGAWIEPSLAAVANGLCVPCAYQSIQIPSLEIELDPAFPTVHEFWQAKAFASDKLWTTDEGTTAEMESRPLSPDADAASSVVSKRRGLSIVSLSVHEHDDTDSLEDAADDVAEIADEALALVQDMWDIAYQAHLTAHDADAFVEMALDLDAVADAITKAPHLLPESFHFLSTSLASLLETAPTAWLPHVEATELKFEALQFRYHAKVAVELCIDLATRLYGLVDVAHADFGLDPATAGSILDGLEELVETVEEAPCELVSWLTYLSATVKLLQSYEREFQDAGLWADVELCGGHLEPLQTHCAEIYAPC